MRDVSRVNDDARRAFLGELIDDAGMFPPARLPVSEALAAHERAVAGDAFWIVGRLVVPAALLAEVARQLDDAPNPQAVSAVLEFADGDPAAALAALARQASARADRVALEAVECPLAAIAGETDDERLERFLAAADAAAFEEPPTFYLEIAPERTGAPEGLLALHRAREREPRRALFAKLRCGSPDGAAIPLPAALASFIWEANRLGVPFKATAGLHHPVRHEALAGEAVHGFLNVIGAAVLARARGLDRDTLESLVAESDAARFELGARRFAWAGIGAGADEIGEARVRFIHSYGSCSLEEPVAGLRALGFLPAAIPS